MPAPSSSAVPSDRLAPNELIEGKDSAFALPLPQLLKIDVRFDRSISARGRVPQKLVIAYVQKRVAGGSAVVTAKDATFTEVRVPSDPDRVLDIHIFSDPSGDVTMMDVKDMTPLKIDPVTPEEAWKRDGITPNNKIVDPLQLR